ncbi:MAG: hypothetical protein OM95_09745 [Bdellovibrio sp. ArHS]|uniref:hypothetical protein n=1 Tax=Bdellovibrio sp. ArHS TaxID=1569284 RepID=UPI00058276C9|nr:hypothetical protein [Bdellovibrio sp. ArHS]KHD88398.1 MAG: hypothetical protein OM95_09745 [Bdellovibrio sp. ArHS]
MLKKMALLGLFLFVSHGARAEDSVVVSDRTVHLVIDTEKTEHYFEDSHGHRWVTKIFLPELQSQLIFDHRRTGEKEGNLKSTKVREPKELFNEQPADGKYPVRIMLTKSTWYDMNKKSYYVFLEEKVEVKVGGYLFESSAKRQVAEIPKRVP